MKICRYDDDRIGMTDGTVVRDASAALEKLPSLRWPLPPGDLFIAELDKLKPEIERAAATSPAVPLEQVVLRSPVANPTKIVCAPTNYVAHVDETKADPGIHRGTEVKGIDYYGLFLKANSALCGPGDGIALRHVQERNDEEVELAVIIGRKGTDISRSAALSYVAGYAIGLDITIRGTQDRSLRKSVDSYAVLGPWLVTADEIPDPGALELQIEVNGAPRQRSHTSKLIYDVPKLIELASSYYTLYPGDIIMTGTPEGVGRVVSGDVLTAAISRIGRMTVRVRNATAN